MATLDFDFEAFKAQKFTEYKKKEIKPVHVRKAKAGIVFTDYKLAGKKTACVFIPIKKAPEAVQLFKKIKNDKEHLLKKTALVKVAVGKDEDGSDKISLEIMKGGLNRNSILAKGGQLFETVLKMKLEVAGGAAVVAEEETQEENVQDATSPEQTTNEKPTTDNNSAVVAKDFKSQVNTIKPKLGEIKNLAGKIKNGKVTMADFDLADEIEEGLEAILALFNQLPDVIKQTLQKLFGDLQKALNNIKKISEKLITADSDDPDIKANKAAIDEIDSILSKYLK